MEIPNNPYKKKKWKIFQKPEDMSEETSQGFKSADNKRNGKIGL